MRTEYEYGYNMEYYIIITVCQSNDPLVNIDFQVRAAADRDTFYTDTNTYLHTIIELVIIIYFVDRKGGEAFSEHYSHSRDARRPIAQPKRVVGITLFFFLSVVILWMYTSC